MSITYRPYAGPSDLPAIIHLVETELSEPYVIYTYRYFLDGWPHLAYMAETSSPPDTETDTETHIPTSKSAPRAVGCVVCKQDLHGPLQTMRGYIAMLSVSPLYRRRGVGAGLVRLAVKGMKFTGADEVMLETEHDNASALRLYERLGFIREKRLFRFYLNGKDAFRLVLAPAEAERGWEGVEIEGEGDDLPS
ncbi:acyl-CoA N-acyltransferase [Dacryopinax primogenitus]|uniref:Acyl-CoA N-acyltransferase n=1 Tax=Dacryopinax primogenitus (strain DJM 731) TaxID=1858805 RepID=M5G9T9_DACPD|nr:acyl-CoA N-acyltransferase [Dacryopinax primogenitus]EJU00603.1 acyl-CoA N-acyltransferase [Dacryopinax primogenitus]